VSIVVITEHCGPNGDLEKATVDLPADGMTLSRHTTTSAAVRWAKDHGHQLGGVQLGLDREGLGADTFPSTPPKDEGLTSQQQQVVDRLKKTTTPKKRSAG